MNIETFGIVLARRVSVGGSNCRAIKSAQSVPEDTGFPLMWFKNREFVRNTYECAVCLEVVKDAVQTCNCGHQFCRYCIDNVLK